MINDEHQLFKVAIERYKIAAQNAKERGDKEAYKEARWKIKYFKDKIRNKKVKKDD